MKIEPKSQIPSNQKNQLISIPETSKSCNMQHEVYQQTLL